MRKADNDNSHKVSVRMQQAGPDDAGQRVDNYLLRICKGVPKSHIYKAIRSGEVRVNKGRVQADYRLRDGDVVRIPPLRLPVRADRIPAPPASFPVIYEDDVLLVINKPSGVAVHGGSGVSFGVVEQLRAARPEQSFLELAHRLDRDTSGLLMLAKRRSALTALHDGLREGRVRRYYQALVKGDWASGRQHLRQPLLRWLTASGERRVKVDPEGKFAHTIVSPEKRYGAFTLLKAELRTGRTHQIRVHLTNQGYPIVGDDKYGNDELNRQMVRAGFKRMFLHAAGLAFEHPLQKRPLNFRAPLDQECSHLLTQLENKQ